MAEDEVRAELLPCPFCGSENLEIGAVTLSLCEVSCNECEASMPSWENSPTWEAGIRDATAKWNRRALSGAGRG